MHTNKEIFNVINNLNNDELVTLAKKTLDIENENDLHYKIFYNDTTLTVVISYNDEPKGYFMLDEKLELSVRWDDGSEMKCIPININHLINIVMSRIVENVISKI